MWLVFGANGQVGREIQRLAPILTPHLRMDFHDRQTADLSQPSVLDRLVRDLSPQGILNAAAYTAVDRAESEEELALRINGEAPGQLAQTAAALGIPLLHISTDYVFNGCQGSPYQPGDPVAPLGAYGRSKRAGETQILAAGCQGIIVRTAWVYGALGSANFVKTMLRLGQNRSEIRVVADQIGSPTWAADLAGAMLQLADRSRTQDLQRIYHYTNSGAASWYDFALAIFEEAQALGFPLAVERVIPITTADYPTPAQRPSYSVLATQSIGELLGSPPPHWRVSLRLMLQHLKTTL